MPTLTDARARWPAVAGWGLLFLAAATLNAGGYRFGASDQAFYIPSVLHHLDGELFPRDWPMLAVQDRLNPFGPLAAAAVRLTGLPVPSLFFAIYLGGLVALFAAAAAIGRRLFASRWTIVSLSFALTLRHAIAMGAVNTLEGYMHPRLVAFGLGVLAVAAFLGGTAGRPLRLALAIALVTLAGLFHPTTAAWFALWLAVAAVVADVRLRRIAAAVLLLGTAGAAWAVMDGPLAGRLMVMDGQWLAALASKTYLFPARWPFSGWLPAVLTPLTAAVLFEVRRRRGLVADAELGLAAGAAVLFAVFLASIPFTAARLALAVQLQVPRTLWLIDFLAVVYIVWYFGEGAPWARAKLERRSPPEGGRLEAAPAGVGRAARAACLVFLAVSLGRGVWVMFVEHPERHVVQVGLPVADWQDAMTWIRANTDKQAWVLAPPGHAWMYGTSVRAAAARDVYLEEAKDAALAMYSRESALRVLDRIRNAAGFDTLTPEQARAMGPDVLVTERTMPLPLLHENERFRVYRLR